MTRQTIESKPSHTCEQITDRLCAACVWEAASDKGFAAGYNEALVEAITALEKMK